MPQLILNADDLGYTPGVNRAVRELAHTGALTSATVMATGAAVAEALAPMPATLGLGAHVVLLDGAPAAAPEQIPTLLDPRSHAPRFRSSLGHFVRDLTLGRIRESEIQREAEAQLRALQVRGCMLTHIDTHKHTHLFPRVLRPLLRAARACGIPAIRNPFEPRWSRQATLHVARVPLARCLQLALLYSLRPRFLALVAASGLRTTDGALGVLATGVLDARVLEALLQAAQTQPGTWELVCHPGYRDRALDAAATRLRAEREVELHALSSVAAGFPGLQRINFASL